MFDVIELNNITDNDLFVIKWRITHSCNLTCSYCAHEKYRETYNENCYIQKKLEDTAKDISKLLDGIIQNKVKIDLIGGEPTIYNIIKILDNISSSKLKRIQITTNFTRPLSYYKELAEYLNTRNIELSLTASFHYQFFDMDIYFEKVKQLKDLCTIFCCEMVSTIENQDLVKIFENKCLELDVDFLIDADTRSRASAYRNTLYSSNRRKNKNPRYKAVLEDEQGNKFSRTYLTRNDLFHDININQIHNSRLFYTKGFYCSVGFNYIYIEFNKIACKTKENPFCYNRISIPDFKQIKPFKCETEKCTLCGNMNLTKFENSNLW